MSKVTIYTSMLCPYCTAAKRLLAAKGIQPTVIDVTFNPAGRACMMERAQGRRSVPQIFAGGRHIGGCDDLYALDQAGELDALLVE